DTAAGIDTGAAAARDKLFSGPLALPDGLIRLFEAAGLARIERTSLTIRMDYENFADYWQPLCGGQGPVGTYLARLSPDLRGPHRGRVAPARGAHGGAGAAGASRPGAPGGRGWRGAPAGGGRGGVP